MMLALVLAVLPQEGAQAERVYVEEVRRDVLKEIDALIEVKDWKRVFEHAGHAFQRFGNHVVADGPDRFTSVREYLLARLAGLPSEAFESYRFAKDGSARAAFEKARESGRRAALERAVDEYFFASSADEVLDQLARNAFDEGRPAEAAATWGRLLRYHPDQDIPKAATAARLALALRAAGSEGELAALRDWVRSKGIAGRVRYAGKEADLADILAGPVEKVRAEAEPVDPAKLPRNDIRRWTLELEPKASEVQAGTPPGIVALAGRRRVLGPEPSVQALAPGEFPYAAASGRSGGRDLVLVGDGGQVTALDPGRVRSGSATAGILWHYPEDRPVVRTIPANVNGLPAPRAPVALAVDGDRVFAPMYSRLEVRPREGLPQDGFDGPTSIKCLHLGTGRLVWDTDSKANLDELKAVGGKYVEKNFAYGEPLVSGDRVYVPVFTSPMGEQESYVLCLERETGRPLWTTFLASTNAMQGGMPWNMSRVTLAQTVLAVHEGVLFAQTNLGVSAGLDPATGTIRWLARYRRAGRRMTFNLPQETAFHRPASPPMAWSGRIYVLAQDRPELLCYEAATGKFVDLGVLRTSRGPYEWASANYLLGPIEDSAVLAGSPHSHLLRLRTHTAASLSVSNTRGAGRGLVHGGKLYLPVSGMDQGPTGALSIFDVRTWKYEGDTPWKEAGDGGHLAAAGEHLAACGRRLAIYTSLARVRAEFAPRLEAKPPRPEAFLEFGDLMKENARLEEAAESYQRFIAAAAAMPAHDARVRQVKSELFAILLKRGEEALGRGDSSKAAESYAFARSFAWDDRGEVDVLSRLARALEKLDRGAEAVAAYLEVLDRPVPQFQREGERFSRAAETAASRLLDLAARHPEAREALERRGAAILAEATGPEGWRRVLERTPGTEAAREAFGRLRAEREAAGDWPAVVALDRERAERLAEQPDRGALEAQAEAADRAGDRPAFERALAVLEARFGTEKVGGPESPETVKDRVARRRAERGWPAPAAPSYAGRLQEGAVLVRDSGEVLFPLLPEGEAPEELRPDQELIAAGSSIELWDVVTGRCLKAWPKPGGWVGLALDEVQDGLRAAAIAPGSPAERAGLRVGDVIVGLAGRPLRMQGWHDLLSASEGGRKLVLEAVRERTELRIEVETAERPAGDGAPPVAACFAGDGNLAVAWPDLVALLDLREGRWRWRYVTGRARFDLRSLHALGGAILAVESADKAQRGKGALAPELAHQRLHAISAATGALLWGRLLDFDPQQSELEASLTFLGRAGEHAAYLQKSGRQGALPEFSLWWIHESGKVERRNLGGNVLGTAWEPGRGLLHYVTDQPERGARSLRSLDPRTGSEGSRPVAADRLIPARFTTVTMTATSTWVAAVMPPAQVGGEARAVAWTLPSMEERVLSLPEGRTMAANAAAGIAVGPAGELLLYTQARDRRPEGQARSFLSAYRPVDAALPVWDAPAPSVGGTIHNAGLRIRSTAGGHVLLTLRRGQFPGLPAEAPVLAVYEAAAEGAVRLRASAAASRAGEFDPAAGSRGRIFVRNGRGLGTLRE